MARADRPDCGMIWYEGALRDHLPLDPHARPADRRHESTASGFVHGPGGCGLPPLDPALRARFVRKFMGFVDRAPALTTLARQPAHPRRSPSG